MNSKNSVVLAGVLVLLSMFNADAGYCSGGGCAGYLSYTTCEAADNCDWEFVCGGGIPCYCGDTVIWDYTLASNLKHSDGSYPCSTGYRITINTSNILFDCNGNSITSEGDYSGAGIYILEADNVRVQNCRVQNFKYGFRLWNSSNATLISNIAENNSLYGFYLHYSLNNELNDNTVKGGHDGFVTAVSNGTTLRNNIVINNDGEGFRFVGSSRNTLTGNNATGGSGGFYLIGGLYDRSDHNVLSNNTVKHTSMYGFWLENSNSNTLTGNTAINNTYYGF